MTDRIKLECQNINHPFQQTWYWFNPNQEETYLNSKKYCTSCGSYLNFLFTAIKAVKSPMPTLYGKAQIITTREQLKDIIDEIYNEGLGIEGMGIGGQYGR